VHAHVHIGIEGLAQERGGQGVFGWPREDGAAVAKEEDAGSEARGLPEVVHGHDDREPIARGQIANERSETDSVANVEEGCRFVEQQNARLLREGAGQGDPALLTSAQNLDPAVGMLDEVAASQCALDGLTIPRTRAHPAALVRGAAHRNDLANAEPHGRALVLRHERHVPGQRTPIRPRHVPAEAPDSAHRRLEEARGHPEERGFPSAICTEDGDHLTRSHLQADPLQGVTATAGGLAGTPGRIPSRDLREVERHCRFFSHD
jgi:hypothetical protein